MPPSAGPAIAPLCHAVELSAIALGRIGARDEVGGERAERRSGEGARDAEQAATANRIGRLIDPGPCRPAAGSPRRAARAGSRRARSSRRSRRSAAQPLIGVSRNKGTNWTRPISPSWKAASRMLIVCASDVIDLPADDDDHRHLRDRRGQARDPVSAEGRNAERFGEQRHALKVLKSLKSPGERPI